MATKTTPETEGGDNSTPPRAITTKEECLAIMDDIIRAYKKLIMLDQPDTQKLLREYTKCFVTAGSIIAKLNRSK